MVVIDNFLNKKTLKQLNNINLWKEYSFDKTNKFFWISKKHKPKNIFESIIIKSILKKVDKKIVNNSVGYQYWINILEDKLDWHLDKDETVWEEQSLLKKSVKNVVYYGYPHKIKGGNLLTHTGHKIEPKYNRLVIFDNTPHAVDNITSGKRIALSVNFWYETPTL
tara:strand:+ start:573 stop:1070 length:498 start_codon:yes stop_codon:yes gene_type:complete